MVFDIWIILFANDDWLLERQRTAFGSEILKSSIWWFLEPWNGHTEILRWDCQSKSTKPAKITRKGHRSWIIIRTTSRFNFCFSPFLCASIFSKDQKDLPLIEIFSCCWTFYRKAPKSFRVFPLKGRMKANQSSLCYLLNDNWINGFMKLSRDLRMKCL